MRLWLLLPIQNDEAWSYGYDTAFGFVVRAESQWEARKMAAEQAGDETDAAWLNAVRSTCEPLHDDGEPGVIIRDFNAG